ncbi:MAG: YgiQ family radical SAM protein [archaeon]|nr:YgiQ family radical SAM protein [archaeon]
MFIPTTLEEVVRKGWNKLDIILVSGDTYIDSAFNGSAIIGHWLIENGFRVGIICQPELTSSDDIKRLGEPELFWSVSSGCVDSMVANYTSTLKFRKDDDFTPGGRNNKRPDRACIAYTNLIKRFCKGKPIVLGGIEASLRRIVHFDFWSNSLRRSILFDAKADIITYGMAEISNLLLAQYMKSGKNWRSIKGICYISSNKPNEYIEIPSYEDCIKSKDSFIKAFKIFYQNTDPITAKGLVQKHGSRYLVHNQPAEVIKTEMFDHIYEMDFEDAVHPYYLKQGPVRSMETIKNSVTTTRGCYGECNFCAISLMQGRTVVSRSENSIIREAERIASRKKFNGIINDVGGPTANTYGFECAKKLVSGSCVNKRCLYPNPCKNLPIDHSKYMALLDKMRHIPKVEKIFIASGLRYDLIVADKRYGKNFLYNVCKYHTSGQLKIAPEHVSKSVLDLMGKPGVDVLLSFKSMFDTINNELNKDQFLTYYLIAAHPGCHEYHMRELSSFCKNYLKISPEQIQIFTPTPSTISTMMYYTHRDWANTNNIKVEYLKHMRQKQKDIILDSGKGSKNDLRRH